MQSPGAPPQLPLCCRRYRPIMRLARCATGGCVELRLAATAARFIAPSPCGRRITAITPASQAGDVGSTPIARSNPLGAQGRCQRQVAMAVQCGAEQAGGAVHRHHRMRVRGTAEAARLGLAPESLALCVPIAEAHDQSAVPVGRISTASSRHVAAARRNRALDQPFRASVGPSLLGVGQPTGSCAQRRGAGGSSPLPALALAPETACR